ncbi:MAG: DUF3014 domain-containing protein [Candidatus Accumulibacter sp.]|nr:DUF3014 domain-containing protein [Accumulibacter sp.]
MKIKNLVVIGLIILLVAVAAYFFLADGEKPVPLRAASIEPAPLPVTPEPLMTLEPFPVTPGPWPESAPEPAEPAAAEHLQPSLPTTAFEKPVILYPIESWPSDKPLPGLAESDAPFRNALGEVIGKSGLSLLFSDELIYHLVVTIDNLPRQYLPASIVPLKRAANSFMVAGKEETLTIDARNVNRYSVYMTVAKATDSAKLVNLYRRHYPLFQNAYREIGYGNANFNDRLVAAIDDLIAAPVFQAPVQLAQPKVLYEYANPDLESRSAGQKIMMRIGTENAVILKAKLDEIRRLIAR